jgi:hypothetical protein
MVRQASRLIAQYRRSLIVLAGAVALGILVVQTVPFVHMAWGALTGGPDLGLVQDLRGELLQQRRFRQMLTRHEQTALQRYRSEGTEVYQRRHLVRIDLTPLGLPGFHDVFAVRVRTDIAEGQALTSFLVRPGVVVDPDAAKFFSGQCGEGRTCQVLMSSLVYAGHTLLRWGLLTPYRMNVTEMDPTSSISIGTEAISTSRWACRTNQLHQEGIGRSFVGSEP